MGGGPSLARQSFPHEPRHLRIAFQQFERGPAKRIGFGNRVLNQRLNLIQHLSMILADLRPAWLIIKAPLYHRLHRRDQFPHPLVPSSHHRHNRHADGGLEHVGLDANPLPLGHVYHVQADHHRRRKRQQLGHQVEVALQRSRPNDGHDHVRLFLDHKVARDHLFRRVGGQAVDARQVDYSERTVVVAAGANLLLDGLAGPVADPLVQAGQQIENRCFADVWLTGQGNKDLSIHCAGPSVRAEVWGGACGREGSAANVAARARFAS